MSKRDQAKQARKSGWKQWRKAQARQTLAEWRKSGLPLEAFARQQGISAQRLRWWRKRLSGEPAAATKKKQGTTVRLVPATMNVPLVDLPGADVWIRFPPVGPVLEIGDVRAVPVDWVGNLLAAVAAARWPR